MAGKVQAGRNVARLQAAHGAIADMMGDAGLNCDGSPLMESVGFLPEPTNADRELARDLLLETVLRKSTSVDSQRGLLRAALASQLKEEQGGGDEDDSSLYIQDLLPDSLVYENEGSLYQRPYSIDSTQDPPTVNFGTPNEVETTYVPKGQAVQESTIDVAFVPLIESAIASDGKTRLKLIDPGWGSSGYYSPEVLKRDGPKVFTEGTKMFLDHPTPGEDAQRPERSVKDLAAVLTKNAQWMDKGPRGPGLYAEAKVFDAHRDALNAVASDIGVSIRAMGESKMGTAEGKSGPIIQRIAGAKSIDFVTEPGRGGRILQLAESKRQQPTGGDPTSKETSMQLTESERKLQGEIATLKESFKTLATQNETMSRQLLETQARDFVRDTLQESLPTSMRSRLIQSLAAQPVLKNGEIDLAAFRVRIDEAVKAEVAYATSLNGGVAIRGMGESLLETAGGDPAKIEETARVSLSESMGELLGDAKMGAIAAKERS